MKRTLATTVLLIFAAAAQSYATPLVRELWDKVAPASGIPLRGLTNGTTSYGFYPSTVASWTINPAALAATNALLVDTNNDVADWQLAVAGPYLPAQAAVPGALSLVNNNTNGANSGWDSGFWAVRRLATTSAINFSANGTYYFSARLIKRGTWWMNDGTNNYGYDDTALGFGLANGSTASSHFVGAGFTRSVAGNLSGGGGYLTSDGATDIGDSVYITTGTLGQAGYANHAADSGGPYYVRAYGTPQEVIGFYGGMVYYNGGMLVGRLTTTSGTAQMDVRAYIDGDTVDTDPDSVTWDATYSFSETANMNYLLVWMYGNNRNNPCLLDGIRIATTWAEALGVEIVGPPAASPTNTVYPGTPVTFSVVANARDGTNEWYQWMTNGVPDTNVVGYGPGFATYTISPNTNNTGMTFSVTFSNSWGLTITSAVTTLTVLAPVPPIVVTQPQDILRYPGAPLCAFSVVADGARPITYQWKRVVGGVTNVLTDQTNATLAFTNLSSGAAGQYLVTMSNPFGSTDSAIATLTAITPTGYAAAVTANNPWGYWRLDEPYGTTNLHDYYGGHDGWLDLTNSGIDGTNAFTWGVYQEQPAAQLAGFPNNHVGIYVPHNGYQAHAQVPGVLNYVPNMTWMGWIYAANPVANDLAEHGAIIWNRDSDNNGGYGNAFGLTFIQNVTGGVTNYNEIAYRWGGPTENPSQPWAGYYHATGLFAPTNSWYFVAVTWAAPNSATVYLGTATGALTVATATLPANFDSAFPGSYYTNRYDILLGRTGYPWAEGLLNANDQCGVSLSDMAIFTNALSSNAVYQIYSAATGELVTLTNSAGNLVLSWPWGTLSSSTNVAGPYAPVSGATSPYTVPQNAPQKFYRAEF
jgi:hypothetical protein